ncbi:ORF6N domain-containing protein [Candidatus Saccharibacteria bacterium]|nr:ORF6N domain-containing protein [Candidatus Saccharibacteria bacterium]
MNEITKSGGPEIKNLIYEIRGKQVMLDSDLAKLYQCKNGTKTINLAVRRHTNRFPERFMFQLTKEEALRFQIETSKVDNRRGGRQYAPYVFTEQGVAMLATVLRTEVAEEMSVKIMDAFVAMRHYINNSLVEQKYYNDMTVRHDREIKLLQKSLDSFKERSKDDAIFFDGQFYDSYSTILGIFNKAKKSLIIIDSYADHTLLDIAKRLKVNVILITTKTHLSSQDVEKYNKQYNNLAVFYDNTFHDRYFILDNKTVYHCGASVNRIGYKTFSINKIDEKEMIVVLLDKISSCLKNRVP